MNNLPLRELVHFCCKRPLQQILSSRLHRNNKKVIQHQQTRSSSQLYPPTSQPWDDAMIQAETILGDTSSYSNLRQWVSGEYVNITKYLQRLVGTNHPMLETAKRCTYIGEGRMGTAQARGLIVLLTAKAAAAQQHQVDEALYKKQISLAEMTEMTYSAYMIHRGVMDLKLAPLEDMASNKIAQSDHNITSSAKAVHYGNKVSVLCGDFLLAYVMRGLGDLHNSKVVDLMATAITEFMEGEFLLIEDWRNLNYLHSENSRDVTRWQKRTFATIGSLQGNSCQASMVLAGADVKLQERAFNFGKNLGFAWQAHTELQPFHQKTYQHVELPEMPPFPAFDLNCLPVILFMRGMNDNNVKMLEDIKGDNIGFAYKQPNSNTEQTSDQVNYDQHRHQESINYDKLHNLIVQDARAIDETYKTIEMYAKEAMMNLEEFPASHSKDIMYDICRSLYSRV